MKIETKFSVGQDVVIFNGVTMQMEHDEVFAVLMAPAPAKEGVELDPRKNISDSINDGEVVVRPQYQLQHHQGLLEEGILFESEEACKKYYLEFFSK